MGKLLFSLVLILSLLPAAAWAEEPAPDLPRVTQVSSLQITTQLAAEIFASTGPYIWGSCSFSCEQCLLNTFPNGSDCPPEMYGRPQRCLSECP